MSSLALTFLAILFVLLNGFFVAAEFAIVKLRLTQAQEIASTHGWPGRILHSVRAHLDVYLSACQLGITLASLGLGWIGEPAFAALLRPVFVYLDVQSEALVHSLSFAIAFGVISYLHIVLGELAPKSLAIRKPEAIALWAATPLWLFYWLMYPFIRLLNGSANLVLRVLRVAPEAQDESEAHSVYELKEVLAASHRHGEIEEEERDLLTNALELSDLTTGELMRPAADMVVLDLEEPPSALQRIVSATRFSRYPVCEGDRDSLIGIVHLKDLWDLHDTAFNAEAIRSRVRKIPEAMRATSAPDLFRMFRRGGPHFAIVRDELGTVVGFITLDHVLEAMIGRVEDEYHRSREDWKKQSDGSYIGPATLPVYSLERVLDAEISAADADSIGGLILERLGRLPAAGERISFPLFEVLVMEMRGPRIGRVRIWPRAEEVSFDASG